MRSSWRSRSVGSRPLKADDRVVPDVLGFFVSPDAVRFVFRIVFLSSEAKDISRDLGVTPLGVPPPNALTSSIKFKDVEIANRAFPRGARGRFALVTTIIGRGVTDLIAGNRVGSIRRNRYLTIKVGGVALTRTTLAFPTNTHRFRTTRAATHVTHHSVLGTAATLVRTPSFVAIPVIATIRTAQRALRGASSARVISATAFGRLRSLVSRGLHTLRPEVAGESAR